MTDQYLKMYGSYWPDKVKALEEIANELLDKYHRSEHELAKQWNPDEIGDLSDEVSEYRATINKLAEEN